ncbi:transposase, partial [Mycobacterium sp.]|uniref:IS110 family transposase n=1 Tax=Mycobacterium sp. TaxID=1785 RepID=UPI00333EFDD6
MTLLFCGIDWAETHHDVAIIDDSGRLVAKKRIPDDPSGFGELIEMLTAAGDCAEAPLPVAIETPRGLLVASLRATGRPVYAINPLAVARYRERYSVARSKSDHADASDHAGSGHHDPAADDPRECGGDHRCGGAGQPDTVEQSHLRGAAAHRVWCVQHAPV